MDLRAERDDDIDAIREVQAAAFRRPDQPDVIPSEAPLVDSLRADPAAWIPELSIVAIDQHATVVGHVVCSRAWIGEERHRVLGLGPIGVLPERQGEGIGSSLVHEAVKVANARGEGLIGLLGNPEYYGRFGFVPSTHHGVDPPDPAWADFFQVLPLANHDRSVVGMFTYAPAFS
jgi:putative acetyltransferase